MSQNQFNLLTEPLFRIRSGTGLTQDLSLPGVLAQLSGVSPIEDFMGLRAHQYQAWHSFLVQLAAMALVRGDETEPPDSQEPWARWLVDLSEGTIEAWCLTVPDLSRPAFMQPPVPEGSLSVFKNTFETPDQLDMLITSKNHDLKSARMRRSAVDQWVYSLVTLQTMQGYLGPGNYGIARMNTGSGSRPFVGYTLSESWRDWFRRDIDALLTARRSIIDQYGYTPSNGLCLLWTRPWDGQSSLPLAECDPYFIEVCRRVRISKTDDKIVAHTTTTKGPRLDAKSASGDTGDPWTPVGREEGKALTVSGSGFHYDLVQRLLFGNDFGPVPCMTIHQGERGLLFHAVVLVRGQGQTDGLHERWLPVPDKVVSLLSRPDGRDRLAVMAKDRVESVQLMRNGILRPALLTLLQGAPKQTKRDDRPRRWLEALNDAVDGIFFEALWEDLDRDPDESKRRWEKRLVSLGRNQLERAMYGSPQYSARTYRAHSAAESMFNALARRHFPDLYQSRPEDERHERT